MDSYDIRRLALVLSIQAEIEGMKTFNLERELNGMSPGYSETAFYDKAQELRNITYSHNEQLF